MAIRALVTPSFCLEVENGRLRVVTDHGLLLVTGEVVGGTALVLLSLAIECERLVPPPAPSPQRDLFEDRG